MNEYGSLGLSGGHQHNGKQIRSEARPNLVSNSQNRPVDEGFDLVVLLSWDENIISSKLHLDSHPAKSLRNDA